MKKILRIVESLDSKKGGPSYSIKASSVLLAKLGIETTIATLDAGDAFFADSSLISVKEFPRIGNYGFSLKLLRWLTLNWDEFDFVVVHGIWQFPSVAAYIASTLSKKKKYVLMPHGSLDVWDRNERKINFTLKKLYWKLIESLGARRAMYMWFTSATELENSKSLFSLRNVSVEVVPYGATPPPVEFVRLSGGAITFGYLGRIHEKKGLHYLIEAFALIKKHHTNSWLTIAGDSHNPYGETLKTRCAELGITDSVHWLGHVTGDSKYSFLSSIDLFVLPSYQENFGLAVAEAMSCGTPVAISHDVNISSIVSNNNAGYAFDRSVAKVFESLEHWVNLPISEKENLRANAFNCFNKHLSIESYVERITAFFRANEESKACL